MQPRNALNAPARPQIGVALTATDGHQRRLELTYAFQRLETITCHGHVIYFNCLEPPLKLRPCGVIEVRLLLFLLLLLLFEDPIYIIFYMHVETFKSLTFVITHRLANRPGMAGIVPELTHGVPCPGRGSFCPGNVKIDHREVVD